MRAGPVTDRFPRTEAGTLIWVAVVGEHKRRLVAALEKSVCKLMEVNQHDSIPTVDQYKYMTCQLCIRDSDMFRDFPGWQPQKCENHVALCRILREWIRREGTGKKGAGGGDSDASAHRLDGIFTFYPSGSQREKWLQEIFLDERSLFGFKCLELYLITAYPSACLTYNIARVIPSL